MKKTARAVARPKAPPVIPLGINLVVRGSALIVQAKERIAWHKRQAAALTAELRTIPPGDPSGPLTAAAMKRDMRRREIERLIGSHEEHARFLTFVARNVIRTREYRVSLQDLSHLEITPKGSYL